MISIEAGSERCFCGGRGKAHLGKSSTEVRYLYFATVTVTTINSSSFGTCAAHDDHEIFGAEMTIPGPDQKRSCIF